MAMKNHKKPLNHSITKGCVFFIVILCVLLRMTNLSIYKSYVYNDYQGYITDILNYTMSQIDADDLKTRFIEDGITQTEIAEKVGVSLPYVNRITRGREQIVNKTFIKILDELGYDVELTYKRKTEEKIAR